MRPLQTVLSQCRRTQATQARPFHSGRQTGAQNHRGQSYRNDRRDSLGRPKEHLLKEEPNSAVLRGKNFLSSPAEALAVIRAVERKYGAIREYRFTKDFELPSHYQLYINVAFRDPNAFERIPLRPESFTVTLPSTIANRPGGIGLDELQGVLRPQDYIKSSLPTFGNIMENTVKGGKEEEITFTIERADTVWYTPPVNYVRTPSESVARSFVKWGGFHDLVPTPSTTPLPASELFSSSAGPHARMRYALQTYSNELGTNILQTIPSNPDASASSLDWEPLPGHESAPTDTPMPSAIHAEAGEAHTSSRSTDTTSQTTSSPTPPSPTSTPASVIKAEAIASEMKKSKKHKAPKRKDEALRVKATSLRDLRTQALQARQSKPPPEPEPATVKGKISSFFSNIF